MMGRRALVVDDDDDHRNWLAASLRDRGWDVIATPSGRLAIEIAERQQPTIVLTELILPDVHGVQLGRALRTVVDNDVRVIAVTRSPHEIRLQACAAGYDHVLAKPIELIELFSAIIAPVPRTLLVDPLIAASSRPLGN
jgi:two-component system, OmpR family, response regulator